MNRLRRVTQAVVIVLSMIASACGGSRAPSVPTAGVGARPNEVRPDLPGAGLGGLTVTEEDITAQRKEAGPMSYLVSSRLWSLRTGKKLQATLQVGLFAADAFPSAEPEEIERFQQRIVGQIGQAGVRRRVVDGHEAFVTVSNDLPVYIWFRGQSLFVLSVAKDYPQPRLLLRQALGLEP